MAEETILVIDAGQDIDQRMTAALEAESYLVYTVSSHDVNAEMVELLKPSLIYLRPSGLSPTGLKPCKAIHGIPLLKKVPIIILASLNKPLGPQYLKDYGIVDFLDLTFRPEELIEKTKSLLGKTAPSRPPKEEEPAALPRSPRSMEKKRSPLLLVAIGIVILLVIAGAGFLAYRQLMPTRTVPPSSAITIPLRAPSTPPKARADSQSPPARKIADASVPAASVPSRPPGQAPSPSTELASQPLRKPFYSVQLGAFKDEDRARALTKKFREKGYDAFTQPGVMKDGSPIYRVLVSKYEDREAAQNLAAEIRSREEIKTTLYAE